MDWAALTRQIAVEEGHPNPDLFTQQMSVESIGFNEDVIYCRLNSPAGARGIAQFMPGTAGSMGIDPCNPEQALRAAARLMKQYYAEYGSWDVALAAYNAGSGAVAQYGGVPDYDETKSYISKIMGGGGISSVMSNAASGLVPLVLLAGGMILLSEVLD
jgi:soluble lytic murein transglycosylase-like protein